MKYQTGDKVKCVKFYNDFTVGKVYTFVSQDGVVSLMDDTGYFRLQMGTWENSIWDKYFEKVGGAISEYQDLNSKIDKITGWDKEADDIMQKVKGSNTVMVVERGDGPGHIAILKKDKVRDFSLYRDTPTQEYAYSSQCQKLQAFKDTLCWLLDYNFKSKEIKQEKIKELETAISTQRELTKGLQEQIDKLKQEANR